VNQPLVSVVIPVYNGEAFLAEAIESVAAQTYRQFELIVIDDGSTDRSGEIARGFSFVRCERQAKAGPGAGRNHGASLSSGQFLAFLDADDLWLSDKLERQLAAFRDEPQLDAVFGHAEEFVEEHAGMHAGLTARGVRAAPLPGAMLIRRAAFDWLGGFETRWKGGEVADFLARLQEGKLRTRTLEAVVLRRRVHARNLGLVNPSARDDYLSAIGASLARRRGERGAGRAPRSP
jgi:glycosyltransferase involved in cell wall biosynthesis